MISRNHSNVSKPAFVTPQVLYCKSRNQLFLVLFFIMKLKNRKKRPVSLFRQSHSTPGPFRANSTSVRFLSILPRTMRKNSWARPEKVYPGGWDCMVYGSCHKSLKTKFDWSETLTLFCELLKVGCDWLFRPQTTVETTDNRIY